MAKTIKAIYSIVSGLLVQLTATDYNTMMQEGEYLASLAKNVAVGSFNTKWFKDL